MPGVWSDTVAAAWRAVAEVHLLEGRPDPRKPPGSSSRDLEKHLTQMLRHWGYQDPPPPLKREGNPSRVCSVCGHSCGSKRVQPMGSNRVFHLHATACKIGFQQLGFHAHVSNRVPGVRADTVAAALRAVAEVHLLEVRPNPCKPPGSSSHNLDKRLTRMLRHWGYQDPPLDAALVEVFY